MSSRRSNSSYSRHSKGRNEYGRWEERSDKPVEYWRDPSEKRSNEYGTRDYGTKSYGTKSYGSSKYYYQKQDKRSVSKSSRSAAEIEAFMRIPREERESTYPRELSPFRPSSHVKNTHKRSHDKQDGDERKHHKRHRYSLSPVRKSRKYNKSRDRSSSRSTSRESSRRHSRQSSSSRERSRSGKHSVSREPSSTRGKRRENSVARGPIIPEKAVSPRPVIELSDDKHEADLGKPDSSVHDANLEDDDHLPPTLEDALSAKEESTEDKEECDEKELHLTELTSSASAVEGLEEDDRHASATVPLENTVCATDDAPIEGCEEAEMDLTEFNSSSPEDDSVIEDDDHMKRRSRSLSSSSSLEKPPAVITLPEAALLHNGTAPAEESGELMDVPSTEGPELNLTQRKVCDQGSTLLIHFNTSSTASSAVEFTLEDDKPTAIVDNEAVSPVDIAILDDDLAVASSPFSPITPPESPCLIVPNEASVPPTSLEHTDAPPFEEPEMIQAQTDSVSSSTNDAVLEDVEGHLKPQADANNKPSSPFPFSISSLLNLRTQLKKIPLDQAIKNYENENTPNQQHPGGPKSKLVLDLYSGVTAFHQVENGKVTEATVLKGLGMELRCAGAFVMAFDENHDRTFDPDMTLVHDGTHTKTLIDFSLANAAIDAVNGDVEQSETFKKLDEERAVPTNVEPVDPEELLKECGQWADKTMEEEEGRAESDSEWSDRWLREMQGADAQVLRDMAANLLKMAEKREAEEGKEEGMEEAENERNMEQGEVGQEEDQAEEGEIRDDSSDDIIDVVN